MNNKKEQQELINILFQIASATKIEPSIKKMKYPQYMEWVAEQLRKCGYDTAPCGMSWGILKK